MKIGAVFPTTEIGNDPIAIRDWAQTAEQLGYSHVLCYDHVLGAVHEGRTPPLMGPYTEKDPFHEPLMLFAYLAGLTTRLEFATAERHVVVRASLHVKRLGAVEYALVPIAGLVEQQQLVAFADLLAVQLDVAGRGPMPTPCVKPSTG